MSPSPALTDRLARALRLGGDLLDDLASCTPTDRRDALSALLAIHDLHLAPIDRVGPAVRWQHHPGVAALKGRLELDLLDRLEATGPAPTGGPTFIAVAAGSDPVDHTIGALRAIAATDRVPDVYRWLADDATWSEMVEFVALEGGPDGGFDDLVAACQIGLGGEAKLELARNYWDEMGRGDLAAVHTELHHRLVAALDLPPIARSEQPLEALERSALGGLLATNRWLQPELVGALGLIELQAGPRCRQVVTGLDRLGAPPAAFPFYTEHADVDPRHGKAWLDRAVAPLVRDHPDWGPRIVRGAQWRADVNTRFLAALQTHLARQLTAAS